MPYYYTDPSRESEPGALPDVEVFYVESGESWDGDTEPAPEVPGWYFQMRQPGELPTQDPVGPFEIEAAALAAARGGK